MKRVFVVDVFCECGRPMARVSGEFPPVLYCGAEKCADYLKRNKAPVVMLEPEEKEPEGAVAVAEVDFARMDLDD